MMIRTIVYWTEILSKQTIIVFCFFYRLEILRQQNPSDVEVAIEPEELEGLDETSIQALYNQRVAEERARNAREVCSLSPRSRLAWCGLFELAC